MDRDKDEIDFIEIDVQPADYEWFSYCVKSCDLELKIIGGSFRVYFEDPEDLYRLGLLVARSGSKDFLSTNSLPVSYDSEAPKPKPKGKKKRK